MAEEASSRRRPATAAMEPSRVDAAVAMNPTGYDMCWTRRPKASGPTTPPTFSPAGHHPGRCSRGGGVVPHDGVHHQTAPRPAGAEGEERTDRHQVGRIARREQVAERAERHQCGNRAERIRSSPVGIEAGVDPAGDDERAPDREQRAGQSLGDARFLRSRDEEGGQRRRCGRAERGSERQHDQRAVVDVGQAAGCALRDAHRRADRRSDDEAEDRQRADHDVGPSPPERQRDRRDGQPASSDANGTAPAWMPKATPWRLSGTPLATITFVPGPAMASPAAPTARRASSVT